VIRSRFTERVLFVLAVVSVLQMGAALGGVENFGPWKTLLLGAILFGSMGFAARHYRLRGEYLRETKGRWHSDF
jgi:hypothetical protein